MNPGKERVPTTASFNGNEGAREKRCFGHFLSLLDVSFDGRLAGRLCAGMSSDKRFGKRWLDSGKGWQLSFHTGR